MRIPDRTLIALSLCLSALGIAGLLLITLTTDTTMPFQESLTAQEGTAATIEATVTSVRHHGNTTFLELEDRCTLPAVVFNHVDVAEGQRLLITGTIAFHDGERELIVERIVHP